MGDTLIYFQDGKLIANSGNASIYNMSEELFLEIGPGHNLWAFESELDDYIEQLNDWPHGECLEIGLGLGVASRYILTFPDVKRLTTIDSNKDVIAAHEKIPENARGRQLNYRKKDHRIYNADGLIYAYETNKLYDFIFLDFYAVIDEDSLPKIADMVTACSRILKPNGCMVGWLDKFTPPEFTKPFFQMFDTI
jgi:2-polyprenyl-3-methyl-5-hydroxy-6-metoxy-1,4-benzoquinol methylase